MLHLLSRKQVRNMKGYHADIEEETKKNNNFRKVLYTGKYQQLVAMSLKPGEDIGEEIHETVDQFFRIEEGEAKVVIDGEETQLKEDDVVIVPAGSNHNLFNVSSSDDLKLYTIYTPPNHPDGTIHKTKAEAEEYEKEHHHS
jgi:mannose-6-phosphate isomerase-like protein (cupin superfamily)